MILCANCGSENRGHASFCLSCGQRLELPDQSTRPAESAADEQSPAPVSGVPLTEDAPDLEPSPAEPVELAEAAAQGPTPIDLPVSGESSPASAEDDQPTPETSGAPSDHTVELPAPEPELMATLDPDQSGAAQPARPAEEAPETNQADSDTQPSEKADEPEPPGEPMLPPLKPGTLLGGRFEIVKLLEESPTTLLYDVIDHRRCAQCGYPDSLPEDLYCASCGAMLESGVEPPHSHLRALRVAGEAVIHLEEESEGRIERWFESDGQLFAVLPIPAAKSQQDLLPFARGVRHVVGYNSDIGRRRELDEDALLALTLAPLFESRCQPSLGLYAVADGMGGHEGGEVASRLAIEGLAETVAKRLFLAELSGEPVLPETRPATLREAFQLASGRICNMQETSGSDMGTTLTAALVHDAQAIIANVGDSRTYHWRDGQLSQITADHSLVAQLVAAEMIQPDDIYHHPEKSAIYRSLGHTPDVEVDIFTQSLLPGDRLVLCCDGVWEMLRDEGIEEVLLLEAEPQRACDEIVRRSNLAGGEDNITVIVVAFEELEAC